MDRNEWENKVFILLTKMNEAINLHSEAIETLNKKVNLLEAQKNGNINNKKR